mmetsp:Transcript_13378/g.25164  ORF Transcript_13378/g.25164 Transcript_13378/m.25164 type:complete len:112 (+) Transcript_13378:591-926(+)
MVELKVTGRFTSGMVATHVLQLPTLGALGFDFKDGNGLVPTVGYNHETTRLVNADTTTGVHSSREGTGNRRDRLNQTKRRASPESDHILTASSSGIDFVQEMAINFKDRDS